MNPEWRQPFEAVEIGKGKQICDGEDIAILTIGTVGNYALHAIRDLHEDGISPALFNMRFVKPLDTDLLDSVFNRFDKIITVEDGCLPGGFGSAIIEFMADHGYNARVLRLGIPDEVIEHGSPEQLQRECGYDAQAIRSAVVQMLEPALAK